MSVTNRTLLRNRGAVTTWGGGSGHWGPKEQKSNFCPNSSIHGKGWCFEASDSHCTVECLAPVFSGEYQNSIQGHLWVSLPPPFPSTTSSSFCLRIHVLSRQMVECVSVNQHIPLPAIGTGQALTCSRTSPIRRNPENVLGILDCRLSLSSYT